MFQPKLFLVLLALASQLACAAPPAALDDDDDDDASPAPDEGPSPLEFASEVSLDELERTIQDLEAFGTRFTYADNGDEIRSYLIDRFAEYGLTAELDPFTVGAQPTANLIARLPGTETPDTVFIFSAHYDSTSDQPDLYAPGADDNASGVAAVFEAARILSDQSFPYSLWFVLTGAEEQGSRGSEHLVGWLPETGVTVEGVIAPDMIGYWPLEDDDLLDILGDEDSEWLVDAMADQADALGVPYKTWIEHGYCYGDDHTNFQEAGMPAITPMDCVEAHNIASSGETTPHYHRVTDTFDTLHMPFTTRVTRVLVATFAALGRDGA